MMGQSTSTHPQTARLKIFNGFVLGAGLGLFLGFLAALFMPMFMVHRFHEIIWYTLPAGALLVGVPGAFLGHAMRNHNRISVAIGFVGYLIMSVVLVFLIVAAIKSEGFKY